MICVREPSEGEEVDGPLAIIVWFDMVTGGGGGGGGDVAVVGK